MGGWYIYLCERGDEEIAEEGGWGLAVSSHSVLESGEEGGRVGGRPAREEGGVGSGGVEVVVPGWVGGWVGGRREREEEE